MESKSELQKDLDKLGIATFEQKVAGLPDTVLIDLIGRVLKQQAPAAVQ